MNIFSALQIKRYVIFFSLLCFFSMSISAEALFGLWENNDRLIHIIKKEEAPSRMQSVLKLYYRYFFEVQPETSCTITKQEAENTFQMKIAFENTKKQSTHSLLLLENKLFTSFFKKIELRNEANDEQNTLEGFWVEEGLREGIKGYPQENPDFFDAYFFDNTSYIQFRYWKDDFEMSAKPAIFKSQKGINIEVPKFLQRGNDVYSCITANHRELRNYESGTYSLKTTDSTTTLTLKPKKAGPGSHAVSDLYPHAQLPEVKNTTIHFNSDKSCFALGPAFLLRSTEKDFKKYIEEHNKKRKEPREPDLKSDEIDFFWDEIRRIRNKEIN